MSEAKHLDAILTIADRELARDDWHGRGGVFYALLVQSVPYLQRMRDRAHGLEMLRRELATAEANASERSDPGSNADVDQDIRRLKALIQQAEVTA